MQKLSSFAVSRARDVKDAILFNSFRVQHSFSTATAESTHGSSSGRKFASYTLFKGKAALSVHPVLPKFSKIASGSSRMEKNGVIMLVFWPAIGTRKYDWEKKQYFALSPTEVGSLVSLGPSESCEFLHDPSMKSRFSPASSTSNPAQPFRSLWAQSYSTYASVHLVLSDGKPRFEINEVEPSTKKKYLTKKRLKIKRKREKQKRKQANRNDPRRIRPKGKKRKEKFPTTAARIEYKIKKAKMKEAILIEKLKKYEVAQMHGPNVKPEALTGEERFYLKKMAQKRSNYAPVGRRGVFGGVILNMHLHWKKHETVTVICKPCKPGQVHEYAREIARLSGGTPIQVIGDDTIVFYRGRNYVQPQAMSPIDTLSKKKALEKSKYEQSLETVRQFIEISEKKLELYYRHVALYGDPQSRNSDIERENLSSEVEGVEEQDGVCSETDSNTISDSDSLSDFDSDSDCVDFEEDGRADHDVEEGTDSGNGGKQLVNNSIY